MQRAGIEPAPQAWQARILPLNYPCKKKVWACPDSNRGSTPCKGAVIAARPQAQCKTKKQSYLKIFL